MNDFFLPVMSPSHNDCWAVGAMIFLQLPSNATDRKANDSTGAVAGPIVSTDMGERTRPRMGLGVSLRETPAGHQLHASHSDHVITVHAGPPVRSSCVKHRSVRKRGDISLMPAGTSDAWFDDDASASLDLRVPTSLLRSVAEEMGAA